MTLLQHLLYVKQLFSHRRVLNV